MVLINSYDRCYIGIDPGKAGGIAMIQKGSGLMTVMALSPAGEDLDLSAITDWIVSCLKAANALGHAFSCIEKVHAMPGNGTVSTFSFGFNTGAMHGILGALHIPRVLVAPMTWKKEVLRDTLMDKNAAIDYCRRMYPEVSLLPNERAKKPHTGMADAICIATYATMKYI